MNIQPLVDALRGLAADNLALNVIHYENVTWAYEDDELIVNTDADEDQLLDRDGNTYSFYVRTTVESEDGYVIFYDADNGCGTRDTVIVSANERAMWE